MQLVFFFLLRRHDPDILSNCGEIILSFGFLLILFLLFPYNLSPFLSFYILFSFFYFFLSFEATYFSVYLDRHPQRGEEHLQYHDSVNEGI